MAIHDVQVILHHESGLPEHDVVNSLHFEVNGPDTLGGLADDLWTAYASSMALFSSAVNGMTVKIYNEGLNPAGPELTRKYTDFAGASTAGASELAICLSYATSESPEQSLPRRRGRIYIGPLAGTVVNAQRPSTANLGLVLDIGTRLAQAGNAGNTTWLMRSQADVSYHKIESIWVDDAWDVQRRRGLAPTLRTVRDVQ